MLGFHLTLYQALEACVVPAIVVNVLTIRPRGTVHLPWPEAPPIDVGGVKAALGSALSAACA